MNLKLNEWNLGLEYATAVCEDLKNRGFNVKAKPYSMYDGRKGIYLQVFDAFGEFFTEYASGICDSLSDLKNSIEQMAARIIVE